jgi:hypothetical protein
LRIPRQTVRLHQLCYPQTNSPRRPHGGELPSADDVWPCFKGDFGEGSSRLPRDLTPIARVLDAVIRRTILP